MTQSPAAVPAGTHTRPRALRWAVWIAVSVVVLGVAVWVAAPVALAHAIAHPPWYEVRTPEQGLRPMDGEKWAETVLGGMVHDPHTDLGLAYEDVAFPTDEGMTLRGWWIAPPEDSRAVVVCVHGGGSDRRDWLQHVPLIREAGYGALLYDGRDCGVSDGRGRGMDLGVRQHRDAIAAVQYVKHDRDADRVVLAGTCHGSQSAILAAAFEPAVDAVISEGAAATFENSIIDNYMLDPIPDVLVHRAVDRIVRRAGGQDLLQPIDVVDRIAPRPLLLMHGAKDTSLPPSNAEALYARAGEPKELWIAPNGKHSNLHGPHPDEFRERMLRFLRGVAAADMAATDVGE